MVYILMGVSGSGKTLIGQKLSNYLGIPFYDGDDFHPDSNIKKMKNGHPLNDDDRIPWLKILARKICEWNNGGAVLACSALKKSYRDLLRAENPDDRICFIYLRGSFPLIAERLSGRPEHFMPDELLESQFKALEEPEGAIIVSIDQPPDEVVQQIVNHLKNIS
ncbi:MAG: gluconokinase [Balneolaceae bacterium]|jgi:carbohydrate kinase (thermoresistant glucokinase family)